MAVQRHSEVWGAEVPEMEPGTHEPNPEAVLAAAVLKLAYDDLQKNRGSSDVRSRRAFREAYVWVASDERRWPFSFLNVCDMLDLSPRALRSKLLTDS